MRDSAEQSNTRPGKVARSPEELFPLIEYCRSGKLKEVGEWIDAGQPIDPPRTSRRHRRQSRLQIAIEKGFFSLAELLLDGGCDPMANGNALAGAVNHRDVDIARLLLSRGVPTDSVHIHDVLDGGPEIIKLFLDFGVDPTREDAYFHGLCSAVNPLLFLLKEYKDRFPDLQRQAEMALCHYSEKGHLRAVSLLLWAGARPDSKIYDVNGPEDPEYGESALEVAARSGNLDILKRLKPQNYLEALKTLLEEACSASQPIIDYLLSIGAALNTKPNGGSRLLEYLLWRLESSTRPPFGISDPTKIDEPMRLLEQVVKSGAKWIPDDGANPRHIRDCFRHLEPDQTLRVFRILKDGGAASLELLELILASPAFRKRLGDRLKSVEHVLHPPPVKATSLKAIESIESVEKSMSLAAALAD